MSDAMNHKHNWCEGFTDPVDPQETEPIRICVKCGLVQGWNPWKGEFSEVGEYYISSIAQDIRIATPQAGADGINPSKLSDNGAAHQIDVLPLAKPPSDNTSQPESVKRGIRQCNACAVTMCLCRSKGSSCVHGYPA